MPINPYVQQILKTPPAQAPDYTARQLTLRDLAQQGRLHEQQAVQAELATEAGRRQAEELRLFNEAIQRGATPDELMRVSPGLSMKLSESQAGLRKTQLENQTAQGALDEKTRGMLRGAIWAVRGAPPEKRAAKYAAERRALIATGKFTPEQLSEQLPDDETLDAYAFFATDAAKRQEMMDKLAQEERAKAAEEHNAAMRPSLISKAEADAMTAQQTAAGTQPITPYQEAQLAKPTGDLAEFKQVFLPGYYAKNGIAQPTAADELKAYQEFKSLQRERVPVPGVDVPLPPAVEEQRRRMNPPAPVGAAKPPTQGERLALGFYMRAADAAKSLDQFEAIMSEKDLAGQVRYQYAPNWMQSDENQQYRQAQRQFTEARLRRDSGAAIPESEFVNDAKMYFPQPGDSRATLGRKRRARQEVLRALRIGAGNAIREIGEEPGDMPAAAPAGSGSKPAANGRPPLSSFER